MCLSLPCPNDERAARKSTSEAATTSADLGEVNRSSNAAMTMRNMTQERITSPNRPILGIQKAPDLHATAPRSP